jgi:hypothetical protein
MHQIAFVPATEAVVRGSIMKSASGKVVWLGAAGAMLLAGAVGVVRFASSSTNTHASSISASAGVAPPAPAVVTTTIPPRRAVVVPERFESLEQQFIWEQQSGLVPITDAAGTGVSGYAFQEDVRSVSPDHTFPVYDRNDLTRQIGVMTDAGFIDLETYNDPSFDLEQVILERWGPERLEQYRRLQAARNAGVTG